MRFTPIPVNPRLNVIVAIPLVLFGLFLVSSANTAYSLSLNHFIVSSNTIYILNHVGYTLMDYFVLIFGVAGALLVSFGGLKLFRAIRPNTGKAQRVKGAGATFGLSIPLLIIAILLASGFSQPVFATISTSQAAIVSSYACDKAATFIVDTDGTYTYAIAATYVASSGCGTLVYGGPANAGSVSGSNATAVINAAWTNMPSAGGQVFLQGGVYSVKTLTLTLPGTLQGASVNSTILSESSTTQNTIIASGNNINIQDLTITSGVTNTAGAAIKVTSSSYPMGDISNINIRHAFDGIVYNGGGSVANVNNIDMRNFASGGIGLLVSGGNDQFFSNIEVDGLVGASYHIVDCVDITGSGGLKLQTSDLYGCETGLLFNPVTAGGGAPCYIDAVSIMNTWVDTSQGSNIQFNTGSSCTSDPVFTDVWSVNSRGGAGIVLVSVLAGQFNGLRVWDNSFEGIYFDSTSTNNIVSTAVITDNNQANNSTTGCKTAGICFGANAGNALISDSVITNNAGVTNTGHQRYAVYLHPGTTSNLRITNNQISGNTVGDIDIAATVFSESDIFSGNTPSVGTDVAPEALTAGSGAQWNSGSSPATWWNGNPWAVVVYLTAVNGISAWTCQGYTMSIVLGVSACYLDVGVTSVSGQDMTVTWSGTAPQFHAVVMGD